MIKYAPHSVTSWQRWICRKIVVGLYVVHSSTSRAIAHALWRLKSNDLNDTLLTGILNAARCLGSYTTIVGVGLECRVATRLESNLTIYHIYYDFTANRTQPLGQLIKSSGYGHSPGTFPANTQRFHNIAGKLR